MLFVVSFAEIRPDAHDSLCVKVPVASVIENTADHLLLCNAHLDRVCVFHIDRDSFYKGIVYFPVIEGHREEDGIVGERSLHDILDYFPVCRMEISVYAVSVNAENEKEQNEPRDDQSPDQETLLIPLLSAIRFPYGHTP